MKLIAPTSIIASALAVDIDYRIQDAASQIASIFLTDSSFNSNVFNHGCWCGKLSSLPSVGLGGKALDDLDQICKSWNKARACTRVEGSNCYNQGNDAMYEIQPAGSGYSCMDTDACLQETCTIDKDYASQLETWWQNNRNTFNVNTDINSNPTCEFGQRSGLYCPDANICYPANYNPQADDFVLGDNQNSIAGYTRLPNEFYTSETGTAWMNKHYQQYQGYNGQVTSLTGDAGMATGSSSALQFSNGNWMRLSEPGADPSTFDFTCGEHQSSCFNDNQYTHNYATFVVGCGSTACSPANLDWSSVQLTGTWANNLHMASIHVKDDLYNTFTACIADGFRLDTGSNVSIVDGQNNSQ